MHMYTSHNYEYVLVFQFVCIKHSILEYHILFLYFIPIHMKFSFSDSDAKGYCSFPPFLLSHDGAQKEWIGKTEYLHTSRHWYTQQEIQASETEFIIKNKKEVCNILHILIILLSELVDLDYCSPNEQEPNVNEQQ